MDAIEMTSFTDVMYQSSIEDAYRREVPIVVTLWSPHWAFADYDLKCLEDPQNIYGDNETIYWFSRPSFTNDAPWLTAVLNEWHLDRRAAHRRAAAGLGRNAPHG